MIRDILQEHMVKTDVPAATWREAVQCAGSLLKEGGKVEDSFVESMIATVEEFGPYMILLPGVAFFHGAPQSGVHEVCLSFVTFEEDVVFTEFEGERIQCAFGFGAVDSESHMQMLMQIAALLQDSEFVELARHHGSKEELMKRINNY